jgi:hypothetical protein
MEILNFDPSVGSEAIELFQRIIAAKFPKQYLEFLMHYNGGHPSPDVFEISEWNDASSVQNFYKINSKHNYDDLLWSYRTFSERIPPQFLAVASDPGGNQICLAVSGQHYGKVFFWDHENEVDEGSVAGMQNMTLVADNFSVFLNNLHE